MKKKNKRNQQKTKKKAKGRKSPCYHQLGDQEALVLEILSRLPVKALMRFKCVCKHWHSVIQKDDFFVNLHLSKSKAAATRTFYLLHVSEQYTNRSICLFSEDLLLPCEVDGRVQLRNSRLWDVCKPPYIDQYLNQHLICTLDGLICFMNKNNGSASIYNSSTRESTPWINTSIIGVKYVFQRLKTHVFGYDNGTQEYKVLSLWNLRHRLVCEVLTVRRNSWRRIEDNPSISPEDRVVSSVYVNGSIYLLCTGNNQFEYGGSITQTIVEFNVGSEKFRTIDHTECLREAKTYLMEFNGRLCLLTYDTQDETNRSIRMLIYDYGKKFQEKKSMMTSSSNFVDWVESKTLSLPYQTELNSIRDVQGTNLFIIRSINDGDSYYYIWNHENGNHFSLLREQRNRYRNIWFDTFIPNILLVN